MSIQTAYNELLEKQKDISILQTAQEMLYWDFETHMPPKGVEQRAEQLALIETLIHERITNPRIGELLNIIKSDKDYPNMVDHAKRNVYLSQREFDKRTKLPKEFVKEYTKQSTITTQIWKKAKKKKDYGLFKPEFDKMLSLVKKRASYLDPNKHPFDVLLDDYEPGMTAETVSTLFNELKEGLIPLIQKCTNSVNESKVSLIKRNCPLDIQSKLSEDVAKVLEYDLERGGIDETEHPFTTGYYDDVRITTHYYENDFADSFYSVLHEAGHAIYEQNLKKDYKYQPIGAYCSLGIHESQSRFYENLLGRSYEFWKFYLPRFKEITGDIFEDISVDEMVEAVNHVEPSKIRVTADEVTYCLHIIIRFELEQELLTGKITTDELPQHWNQKYKEYLGVEIENDAEGVLQDTHWSGGDFGYFPTYALGNIYNAQMLHQMRKEIPNYSKLIETGELKPINTWLEENVHQPSNLYDPIILMKRITKEEITPKYFLKYLEEKYSKIYGF